MTPGEAKGAGGGLRQGARAKETQGRRWCPQGLVRARASGASLGTASRSPLLLALGSPIGLRPRLLLSTAPTLHQVLGPGPSPPAGAPWCPASPGPGAVLLLFVPADLSALGQHGRKSKCA